MRRAAWLRGRDGASRRARLESIFTKARKRDGMRAFESLTAIVDGRRVILEDPPVVTHIEGDVGAREGLHGLPVHHAGEPA